MTGVNRAVKLLSALVVGVGVGQVPAMAGGDALPPTYLGPGDAGVHDMGKQALIRNSKYGYVYIAGQQDSRLRITYDATANALRYRDTGTERFKSLIDGCTAEPVKTGVSAVCTIPDKFADPDKAMFVQVWPRLGDDFVDGRGLPARFRLWVLTDAGDDVVKCGDGDDFVNGAKGDDRIYGGAGDDWLRGGPGHDQIDGGSGRNRISDDDTVHDPKV